MLNETWQEQYQRMKRSYARLNQKNQDHKVMEARDTLYHFCCDAFHLRDWIAATLGGTDEATTKALAYQIAKELILPSPELSACCDIANGVKHFVLHRKSYVTRDKQGHATVVSESVTIHTTIVVEHTGSGTADVMHTDGTWDLNVPLESESIAASEREAGWVQNTFEIEINRQKHDAHDVATKAVAAWDNWLSGTSPIAGRLR